MSSMQQNVQKILDIADIKINGTRPWDIRINNEGTYKRVLKDGNLGLGESYMAGWWDCDQLDVLFDKIITARIPDKVKRPYWLILPVLQAKLFNLQSIQKSKIVGEKHYDIGNELYSQMLDPYMQYTCGYWKDAKTLADAQIAKLELICKKLQLKQGMSVLDIGCGWGGFAKYAAQKYKVNVVGITISKEQLKLAQKFCKELPVKILFKDYREMAGKFDRILSIGMFEHVGPKNYKSYFDKTNALLKDDGIALLHTIGYHQTLAHAEIWYSKYIFPGGFLPSAKQISENMEGKFRIEDWHNFGAYYDPTMVSWFKNFDKSWPKIKHNYSETFYRMWKYYLLSSAGLWRARELQLWQIVMTKYGMRGGYIAPR